MDTWTLQQIPKFPGFSFPKAGHIPRTPGARASWPQTSSSGNAEVRGRGGGSWQACLGLYTPRPKLPLRAAPAGLTGPGLRRRRAQGPRLWLRWCRLWLGLRPGAGGAQALLRRGAGLDGVRPSSPHPPTRETLPPALTLHLPWPEQGAPTYGHRHTGEQTGGHVDTGPAQDLGSDLGRLGERTRRWASRPV